MPIPLGILAVAGAGAAGGASAFDLLETTLISTNTSSVTFSNLNNYSDYKHLQIRATGRTNRSANYVDIIKVQLNADTGSNYSEHGLGGNGSAVSSYGLASQTGMPAGRFTAALVAASVFGSFVTEILDFSNSSKNTTIRGLTGFNDSGDNQVYLHSGAWLNTNAVTSITLLSNSGNSFVSGSRFSLYGIK